MPACLMPAPTPDPAPPRRYIAGVTIGHDFDEAARAVLAEAGATVLAHYPRIDLVVLEIADVEAFSLPPFLAFLEEDRQVGLG